jgi:hypothetical protein
VIDVENSKVLEGMTVKIKSGKIVSIGKSVQGDLQEEGYTSIKADGLYLCPGLIDCGSISCDAADCRPHPCHSHARTNGGYFPASLTHKLNAPQAGQLKPNSETEVALKTTYVLKGELGYASSYLLSVNGVSDVLGMLSRGFTTVRDVGGANRHFKEATEQWLIPGPRLFQGGPVMSQTGGHGASPSKTSHSPNVELTLIRRH